MNRITYCNYYLSILTFTLSLFPSIDSNENERSRRNIEFRSDIR